MFVDLWNDGSIHFFARINEQDAKNKIANYLAGQSAVQGWVGSMVSNQLGSMFTGAPQQPASRV